MALGFMFFITATDVASMAGLGIYEILNGHINVFGDFPQ